MNKEELIQNVKEKFNLKLAKKDEQTIIDIVEKYSESKTAELKAEIEKLKKCISNIHKIATDEENSTTSKQGGEPSNLITNEDKVKMFSNGYWSAAHNISHDIEDLIKAHNL